MHLTPATLLVGKISDSSSRLDPSLSWGPDKVELRSWGSADVQLRMSVSSPLQLYPETVLVREKENRTGVSCSIPAVEEREE